MPDGIRASCPLHHPAYELSTQERKHTSTHTWTSQERHQHWEKYTQVLCMLTCRQACTRTHQQAQAWLRMSPPRTPSLPLVRVMTTTDDPKMENNLQFLKEARWHTNTCSCMLTCFYCGRLLRPLSNENHMMAHIQLWKNNRESPPRKKTHQQIMLKKNSEDSEAKLSGDLIPAVLLRGLRL